MKTLEKHRKVFVIKNVKKGFKNVMIVTINIRCFKVYTILDESDIRKVPQISK